MENTISWFEIPVKNFVRAKKFYEAIFKVKIQPMDFQNFKMGFFPGYDKGIVSGALVHGEHYAPSKEGVLIYLSANPDLQKVLDRVKKAGGKVMQPKTQISEHWGYMALVIDTEGNRIGLHSVK